MTKPIAAVAVILFVVFLVHRAKAPSNASPAEDAASHDDQSNVAEQALLVHIPLSDDKFGTSEEIAALQALELELETLIAQSGVGELDGNEIGGGEYLLFIYGPSADRLLATVEAKLRESPAATRGTWALKRYGSADAEEATEVRVPLK